MEKLTAKMEDYLKTIFQLRRSDVTEIVRISDIAATMNISKASACRATDVLCNKGLLHKDRYVGVYFTEKGFEQALFIIRRFSVIQTFLTEILKIDSKVAKDDACGIEHAISIESYKSICQFMTERKYCIE